MSNFTIKESPHRVDPRSPERTDPEWKRAYNKGQQLLKSGKGVKFANKGEKEYYDKMLRKNPQNVPGLPILFPALPEPSLSMYGLDLSGVHFDSPKPLPCGHSWTRLRYSTEGKIFRCKYGHEYNEEELRNNSTTN